MIPYRVYVNDLATFGPAVMCGTANFQHQVGPSLAERRKTLRLAAAVSDGLRAVEVPQEPVLTIQEGKWLLEQLQYEFELALDAFHEDPYWEGIGMKTAKSIQADPSGAISLDFGQAFAVAELMDSMLGRLSDVDEEEGDQLQLHDQMLGSARMLLALRIMDENLLSIGDYGVRVTPAGHSSPYLVVGPDGMEEPAATYTDAHQLAFKLYTGSTGSARRD